VGPGEVVVIRFLPAFLGVQLLAAALPALPALSGTQTVKLAAGEGPPAEVKIDAALVSAALAASARDFKQQPNELTWQAVSQSIKALLSDARSGRAASALLIKANPELKDLGLQVLSAGGAELWTFPKIAQARELLVRWQETRARPPARAGRIAGSAVASRVQSLYWPTNVAIGEARVIDVPSPRALPAEAPRDKKAVAASSAARPKIEGGRFLVILGSDRAGGNLWIKSFKLAADGWKENQQLLSGIPPYLLSNVKGKLSFSGSDLSLTIQPPGTRVPEHTPAGPAGEPVSPSYKLALRLVNGRYALEGKAVEDTPYNAVYQFSQALASGRLDVAKAWLVDPKLFTVARYVKLSGNSPGAMRILNMSGPPSGTYRFRLVTFDKNDLVLDVGKSKTLWAIRAIFVAPADPLIQQIARDLPAWEAAPEASTDSGKPGAAPPAGR
jgi:hypothetical protein